jgi:hypothetical protein
MTVAGWGFAGAAGVGDGGDRPPAVGQAGPLAASVGYPDRVGGVGDAVPVPVGGDGGGGSYPQQVSSRVGGRRAQACDPRLAGGDGPRDE